MDNLTAFIELNRRFLVDGWQSFNGEIGDSFGIDKGFLAKTSHGGKSINERFSLIPSRILTASEHLQGYDSPAELIDELLSQGYSLFEILEGIEGLRD